MDGGWNLNQEIRLVLTACKLNLSEKEIEYIYDTVSKGIDYSKFIYYCVHNRVVSLVWRNLKKTGVTKKLEGNVKRALEGICDYIYNRNILLYHEIEKINVAFEKNDLKAILLKGAILAPLVYGDISLREFGDVDYLVKFEDIKKVEEILADIGYIQGKYDSKQKKIIPASRFEIIQKKKYTHELVEFLKIDTANSDLVHMVDINHAIFWKGRNNQYSFDTNKIFENANKIKILNSYAYNMEPELQLIQLCAHLYSEAVYFLWDSEWTRNKAEVCLYRFCDIYEIIRKGTIDGDKLKELVVDNNIEEPIAYCFYCLKLLFGQNVLYNNGNVFPENIIDKYFDTEGKEHYWQCDIFERLFDVAGKTMNCS